MRLIRITPNEGGAYPAIQEGDFRRVPEGMAVWPEELPTREFYDRGGFATLTVEQADGVPTVTGVEPDEAAWQAWQAAHPPEPAPAAEPGEAEDVAGLLVEHEYRLALLELGLTGGDA